MPNESDNLIRDLGEIIAAREAMKVADDATSTAIDRAVRSAGVAVSKTINRTDGSAITRARELLAECRNVMEKLGVEVRRAQAAADESERLSRRSIEIAQEIQSVTDEIRNRRRRN